MTLEEKAQEITLDVDRRIKEIRAKLERAGFSTFGITMHQALPLIKDDLPWILDELEKTRAQLEELQAMSRGA